LKPPFRKASFPKAFHDHEARLLTRGHFTPFGQSGEEIEDSVEMGLWLYPKGQEPKLGGGKATFSGKGTTTVDR